MVEVPHSAIAVDGSLFKVIRPPLSSCPWSLSHAPHVRHAEGYLYRFCPRIYGLLTTTREMSYVVPSLGHLGFWSARLKHEASTYQRAAFITAPPLTAEISDLKGSPPAPPHLQQRVYTVAQSLIPIAQHLDRPFPYLRGQTLCRSLLRA